MHFVAGISRKVSLEGVPRVRCLTSVFLAMLTWYFANSIINLDEVFPI